MTQQPTDGPDYWLSDCFDPENLYVETRVRPKETEQRCRQRMSEYIYSRVKHCDELEERCAELYRQLKESHKVMDLFAYGSGLKKDGGS